MGLLLLIHLTCCKRWHDTSDDAFEMGLHTMSWHTYVWISFIRWNSRACMCCLAPYVLARGVDFSTCAWRKAPTQRRSLAAMGGSQNGEQEAKFEVLESPTMQQTGVGSDDESSTGSGQMDAKAGPQTKQADPPGPQTSQAASSAASQTAVKQAKNEEEAEGKQTKEGSKHVMFAERGRGRDEDGPAKRAREQAMLRE